jgi:FMN phosphatase YigB (HAD superfamily)
MNPRALISDIYNTLLEVGPPPADASERWEFLWENILADPARLSLKEFAAACEKIIAREHDSAIRVGVQNPEIYWPTVAKEALPELARLAETERDDFLYQHAQLQRTTRLMPGAGEVLHKLEAKGVLLGLASNCQPYTLRELDAALAAAKLNRAMFKPELCFFSFAAGFSKPNPHAFRLLRTELQLRGILPADTLLVGDRLVNDLEPARSHGFQTWRLTAAPSLEGHDGGDWRVLERHLAGRARRG